MWISLSGGTHGELHAGMICETLLAACTIGDIEDRDGRTAETAWGLERFNRLSLSFDAWNCSIHALTPMAEDPKW